MALLKLGIQEKNGRFKAICQNSAALKPNEYIFKNLLK